LPPTIQNGVTVVQKSSDLLADSVKEKGEGQIILLHGPPGVGKTCTAGKTSMFWLHRN
jgi:ATP-dependent Lon protease